LLPRASAPDDDDNAAAQSSSLLLAALDLASFSALSSSQQPPLPLLNRQGHYRPIGAFAIQRSPPLDASSTSSSSAADVAFRVPVADLVVDNYPMRGDIEIAEIYAGQLLSSANPNTTTNTDSTIRINHAVESVPFPLVRSEKYSGLFSSRFFYALSCLVLLVLIVAIVYAMDVLQDGSR
jgi:hypothetical protein